jgi:hypothetical protein
MRRWLFIAAAALLTLGGLILFSAPAMARDYHPRPAHVATRARHAARYHADVWHAAQHHAAHLRAYKHAPHRR